MSLDTRVLNAVRRHRLIPPESVLIVAVSGGADSLALLHLLRAMQGRLQFRLHAATLDHGLRGAAGAEDVRYVKELCDQWGISCTAGTTDVPALMKAEKLGVEAAARRARYAFLASVAREQRAERIAVAHHLGDQAETVLMHLLRGSGVTGLRGMAYAAPMPDHPALTVIRPLLNITRHEIEAYLEEHGIAARHDATNDLRDYTRNQIRLDVLPALKAINPQVERVLAQLAETAAVEDDYMRDELQRIIHEVNNGAGQVSIPRQQFSSLHPALQRRLIRWAVEQVDAASEPGYEHIVRAVEVAAHGRVGARALLPRKLHLRVDYETVVVERREAERLPPLMIAPDVEITAAVPGETRLNGWTLYASFAPSEYDAARLALPEHASVKLRTRRDGDRFAPIGMAGRTQKISAWMINRKIPQSARARVPLLFVDGKIAAIIWGKQWAVAEDFAVRSGAQRVVYFRVTYTGVKNSPIG